MKKLILIMVMVFVVFSPELVMADSGSNNVNYTEAESLYDYMTTIKDKYEITKDIDIKDYIKECIKTGGGNISFSTISKAIVSYAFSEVQACIKILVSIIIISVICALLTNLQRAFSKDNLSNIAYFACYAVIIILVSKSFYIGVSEVKNTIQGTINFMGALMPVLLILMASGGRLIESAALDPIIISAINIAAVLYINVIIPLILVNFILQLVNNISEEYKIDKLAKLIFQLVMWIQGITMTVFIAIVTIRGVSTKALDEVTAKTAKFAVDSFIPIVGKSLSDAISTVVGYSVLLKNAVSTLGLIFLIAIVIFPIIKVMLLGFMHKITAALVQPISDKRIVNCVTAAGDTLIILGSCLISLSVMFFIIISIIASTTAVN